MSATLRLAFSSPPPAPENKICRARIVRFADWKADAELTEDFFWKARSALDVLNAANADPGQRARATRLWAELYRTVHSPRDEISGERAERIGRVDKLAAVAGLSPILFNLQEFALDIVHVALTSREPAKALDHILGGTRLGGRPGRPRGEAIGIAVAVETLRAGGATLSKACGTTSRNMGKSRNLTGDAVYKIHKRAMKNKAQASLARLIEAGLVEF